MYYYKARIYSPTLGRFLQTDPIGYEDQFNLYAYVENDPVNSLDPTGKCSAGALVVGGGAAIADGPVPIGDAIGGAIVAGDCIYRAGKVAAAAAAVTIAVVGDWLFNEEADDGPENAPDVGDFEDPDKIPEGWEWRGNGEPGSREGAYVNPETGETVHDDRTHPVGKDPHWTYTDQDGQRWDTPDDDRGNWTPQ